MNKGIIVIEERGDRRYGRMVQSSEERIATSPPMAAPRNDRGSDVGAEERKARFCADEDVEILTAVNQLRKEQRRRDAAMAQQRKKAVRKQRIVKAVCLGIDVLAYVSCLFAFVLLMLTQNRLIAVGMLAMAAVYAIFTMRLEGK